MHTRTKLNWLLFALQNLAYLYWSANEQLALQRLSRRLSQVCESVWIHACQCVYADAAHGFTLRRSSHNVSTGSAGAFDLVGMPASSLRLVAILDSGSLHFFIINLKIKRKENNIKPLNFFHLLILWTMMEQYTNEFYT